MGKHNDRDNPPLTAAELASAKRGIDHLPQGMQDALRSIRRRGPQKAPRKRPVSIRLSPEVIANYKEAGPGWQKRINADLTCLMNGQYKIVSGTPMKMTQAQTKSGRRGVPKMHGGVLTRTPSAGRARQASSKKR